MILIFTDLQLVGTAFAALLGLAFGSFLNVVLTRFPEGESIATPRSHCRKCDHTLAWWENLPVLSWLLLRGRCRKCGSWISLRYPLIELVMGLLWAGCWLSFGPPQFGTNPASYQLTIQISPAYSLTHLAGCALLCWLLVALAALDAEYFWLPDWFTLPGIGLGFFFTILEIKLTQASPGELLHDLWFRVLAILAAAGLILFIRLAYWLVRRQEGMGLGDAKLMAMLAAWLGLRGALESFALAIFAAAAAALVWLAVLAIRRSISDWARMPLPMGTFLCVAALSEVFRPHWLSMWLHLDALAG